MAFVPALTVRPAQAVTVSALSVRRGRPAFAAAVPRRVRMCAEGGKPEDTNAAKKDEKLPGVGARSAAQVEEDAVEQTWQGNLWFAVITGAMAFAMMATLARDFVPGGGPAMM